MKLGRVENSPGFIDGYDPYTWESDDEAHAVLPADGYQALYKALKNRTNFVIGDSLSRQWSHSLSCELRHVHGIQDDIVRYCDSRNYFATGEELDDCLGAPVTSRDYSIVNYGHHQDPRKRISGTQVNGGICTRK
jgi:hypothetical protein